MKYRLFKNKKTNEKYILVNNEDKIYEKDNSVLYKELRKKALNNLYIRQKNDILSSIGLKKVKGSLGGIYWE